MGVELLRDGDYIYGMEPLTEWPFTKEAHVARDECRYVWLAPRVRVVAG